MEPKSKKEILLKKLKDSYKDVPNKIPKMKSINQPVETQTQSSNQPVLGTKPTRPSRMWTSWDWQNRTEEEKNNYSAELTKYLKSTGESVFLDTLPVDNFRVAKTVGGPSEKQIIENDDEVTFDHISQSWTLGTAGRFYVAFMRQNADSVL